MSAKLLRAESFKHMLTITVFMSTDKAVKSQLKIIFLALCEAEEFKSHITAYDSVNERLLEHFKIEMPCRTAASAVFFLHPKQPRAVLHGIL
ncbi:TPA: hypothetical protein DDW35_01195 [Candidatus Sumerlaeota bacterium]|nr:hypothetical protein [Candidatus Sumerlaeota bacterium]